MVLARAILAAAAVIGLTTAFAADAAVVGKAAPGFEADSSAGRIALADFQGKKNVLLAFYFADFTAG